MQIFYYFPPIMPCEVTILEMWISWNSEAVSKWFVTKLSRVDSSYKNVQLLSDDTKYWPVPLYTFLWTVHFCRTSIILTSWYSVQPSKVENVGGGWCAFQDHDYVEISPEMWNFRERIQVIEIVYSLPTLDSYIFLNISLKNYDDWIFMLLFSRSA